MTEPRSESTSIATPNPTIRRMPRVAIIALGGIALVLGLTQIWGGWNFSGEQFRWFAITGILATSLAHANLLLLLSGRRHSLIRLALAITLAAIAMVALLLVLPILTRGEFPGDDYEAYSRWLGVFAIIDALGTIVTPIMALFVRDAPTGAEPGRPADPLEQRIATLASETGLDRVACSPQLSTRSRHPGAARSAGDGS